LCDYSSVYVSETQSAADSGSKKSLDDDEQLQQQQQKDEDDREDADNNEEDDDKCEESGLSVDQPPSVTAPARDTVYDRDRMMTR